MDSQDIINKIIKRMSRFDFLFGGKEDLDNAGRVHLLFTDNSVLELDLAHDGESIEYKWRSEIEVEEEEKLTDWFRIDLTNKEPFMQIIEQRIIDYDELLFGTNEEALETMVVAGLGFKFENGMSLIYYNNADNSKLFFNEMPPPYPEHFKLVWKNRVFEDITLVK